MGLRTSPAGDWWRTFPASFRKGTGSCCGADSWTVPRVFPWLQALGSVETAEMDRVFNMGIGLVIVVAEYFAEAIVRQLSHRLEIACWIIGEVVPGERTVSWQG